MRRKFLVALVTVFTFVPRCVQQRHAQAVPAQNTRKVLVRVTPSYPDLARRLSLSGTVKLVATVASDGTVKATKPVGGNPVLLQAGQDALRKWKWQPAAAESRELIEISFHPIKAR